MLFPGEIMAEAGLSPVIRMTLDKRHRAVQLLHQQDPRQGMWQGQGGQG
jgi:hypothetical protein